MKFAVTFQFKDGCSFTDIYEVLEGDPALRPGFEQHPFPNEKGNSQAFGLAEYYAQSDKYGTMFSLRSSNPAYCLVIPYED